jgi:hypothetical protein
LANLRGASTAEAKPERATGNAVTSFKAPLLTRILDLPESEQRVVALDLGPPSQALIDALTAKRRCRFEIADLVARDGLGALQSAPPESRSSLLQQLLPRPNSERLNLIFCWDLPNYLSLPTLQSLCALLGNRAAPDCRLHMLISYSKRDMAAAPARYVPTKDGQLTQIGSGGNRSPAPRYSPEDLGKALGGFRYQRGVLLANGMQEFVYAWPGQSGQA